MPKNEKSTSNLMINNFLRHFPDEIAIAFFKFSTDYGKEVPHLDSKRLEQCAATLERCLPFYQQKFKKDPVSRLEFTKHFFAGACGFGNKHIERFPIRRENIERLFGSDYVITFDECAREHSKTESLEDRKKTILENEYFGDYVAACRWLSIVFRTVLGDANTSQDDSEMRSKFRAVLLIGYLMNKDRAYDLQQYIEPTLSKETTMKPTLVTEFVEFYMKLHKAPSSAEDGVSESLYTTIFNETVKVYKLKGIAKRCKYCGGFYFDGSFNKYYLHEQYCCSECYHIENVWQKKFSTAAESLRTSLKRQTKGNVLKNSCLTELLKFFTYPKAKARFNEIVQENPDGKALKIDDYFLELFTALHITDDKNSTFLLRPDLYAYLSGAIEYDRFCAEIVKHKNQWGATLITQTEALHDELHDIFADIWFIIR